MGRMNHWAADQETLLDAKITGFKAGLKLTPDQERLWAPFETAVRDADKMHIDQMKSMMDRMQKMRSAMQQQQQGKHEMKDMSSPDEAVSPVERLQGMAQRMSERGAAMMKVADAAKPLYASLDDAQKRLFALLGGQLFMMGPGHPGMGMMRGWA
jgi:zinc resistance-associated protein